MLGDGLLMCGGGHGVRRTELLPKCPELVRVPFGFETRGGQEDTPLDGPNARFDTLDLRGDLAACGRFARNSASERSSSR